MASVVVPTGARGCGLGRAERSWLPPHPGVQCVVTWSAADRDRSPCPASLMAMAFGGHGGRDHWMPQEMEAKGLAPPSQLRSLLLGADSDLLIGLLKRLDEFVAPPVVPAAAVDAAEDGWSAGERELAEVRAVRVHAWQWYVQLRFVHGGRFRRRGSPRRRDGWSGRRVVGCVAGVTHNPSCPQEHGNTYLLATRKQSSGCRC